jgi:hypothetical protein
MTAQEKAYDLFTTYRFALSHKDASLGVHKDDIAKQCALIAVDEIIHFLYNEPHYKDYTYWQEVKKQIKNI